MSNFLLFGKVWINLIGNPTERLDLIFLSGSKKGYSTNLKTLSEIDRINNSFVRETWVGEASWIAKWKY